MTKTNTQSSGIEVTVTDKTLTPATSKLDVDANTTPSTTTSSPLYKIVRVRKPDGSIVKVKRPLTTEEASKIQSSLKQSSSPTTEATNEKTETKAAAAPFPHEKVIAAEAKAPKKNEKLKGTATASETCAVKVNENTAEVSKSAKSERSSNLTKPTEAITTSETDHASTTTAKGTRLYRGLHKLHRGSSRVINALAPEWDIKDMEDADEEISDFSDDEDNEDEEKYDSDDEKDGEVHQKGVSNVIRQADSKEVATVAVANVEILKTPRAQNVTHEKTAKLTNGKESESKKTRVNEKDISGSDLEKGFQEKPAGATTEGRDLKKRYTDWSRYVIWSIIILFPLLFVAVGILVACRDKMAIGSEYGIATDQALQVAVSVWPIIFAGIVAQSLRAYATYRVERGVRLMTLEQLVNSNSVAASFKQPFLLRRFNWITVSLLTLWGLSPLATQAMQRISTADDLVTDTSLRFANTTTNGINYLAADGANFDSIKGDFDRLYSAAFLPSNSKVAGADAYNNALIPALNLSAPSDEWQDTDPTSGLTSDYISSYGIPIALPGPTLTASAYITSNLIFNITLTTGYLSFTCDPVKSITSDDLSTNSYQNLRFGDTGVKTLLLSMTPMSAFRNGTLALASLITLNTTSEASQNYTLLKSNATDPAPSYAYTSCDFWQTFVDAYVSCQSSLCYTYAIRRTQAEDLPMQLDSGAQNWLSELYSPSETIKTAAGSHQILTSAELFLFNRTPPGSQVYGVNLTAVPHQYFVSNLALMMNTYWTIGFAPTTISFITGNGSTVLANDGDRLLPLVPPESYADGIQIELLGMFVTRWGWLAALILCSTTLLLAGIFSIWWDARTVSPDVLGFASSVVRKSKYVQLPKVDGTASGAERTRALGEVRVMMQDVKPAAEVGRIALGTAHPNAKRLVSGRNYR